MNVDKDRLNEWVLRWRELNARKRLSEDERKEVEELGEKICETMRQIVEYFVRKYAWKIKRKCEVLGVEWDTESVKQEMWVRMCRCLLRWEPRGHIFNYFYTACRNFLAGFLSTKPPFPSYNLLGEESDESLAIDHLSIESVHSANNMLDDQEFLSQIKKEIQRIISSHPFSAIQMRYIWDCICNGIVINRSILSHPASFRFLHYLAQEMMERKK